MVAQHRLYSLRRAGIREGQCLSTLYLIWSAGLGVEDDLHFFSTSSSSSLEMLSVGRGVDGGWEGFIQGGPSKVAALGSYVFIKKLLAVFSSKSG